MFTVRELDGNILYGNVDWKVSYIGIPIIDCYMEFQRDFFNRTLIVPPANDNWLYCLNLSE